MKKIYLVRHGESNGNASGVYQNADTPLTEKGRAQAEFIASRCEKFAIDFIVSSSMKRAVETAAIVNKKLNKLSEISDLFVFLSTKKTYFLKFIILPLFSVIHGCFIKKIKPPLSLTAITPSFSGGNAVFSKPPPIFFVFLKIAILFIFHPRNA